MIVEWWQLENDEELRGRSLETLQLEKVKSLLLFWLFTIFLSNFLKNLPDFRGYTHFA